MSSSVPELRRKLSCARLSLTFIRDQLRDSEVPSVGALAGLFQQNASDLASYLTSHPQGVLVPKFLEQLGAELAREHALLQKECEQLARSLEELRDLLPPLREQRPADEQARRGCPACPQPAPYNGAKVLSKVTTAVPGRDAFHGVPDLAEQMHEPGD